MIINEGIGDKPTKVYKNLISMKFVFTIICIIIVVVIWFTFENNIYAGLSMMVKYEDTEYKKARRFILGALILFSIFLFFDILIQVTGITYSFYKLNSINLSLKLFETFLLGIFFLDSWHYITLYYIFAVTEFICLILEISSILISLFSTFKKYNKIRHLEIKTKK